MFKIVLGYDKFHYRKLKYRRAVDKVAPPPAQKINI